RSPRPRTLSSHFVFVAMMDVPCSGRVRRKSARPVARPWVIYCAGLQYAIHILRDFIRLPAADSAKPLRGRGYRKGPEIAEREMHIGVGEHLDEIVERDRCRIEAVDHRVGARQRSVEQHERRIEDEEREQREQEARPQPAADAERDERTRRPDRVRECEGSQSAPLEGSFSGRWLFPERYPNPGSAPRRGLASAITLKGAPIPRGPPSVSRASAASMSGARRGAEVLSIAARVSMPSSRRNAACVTGPSTRAPARRAERASPAKSTCAERSTSPGRSSTGAKPCRP